MEVWEPRFTYRGFRYAELVGYPGVPSKETLTSQVLHNAPAMAGRFECSNPLINQILQNVVWGQRSNLHSVPTDCPQRDERLGWMGDAQIFAPTSCWNMDMARFYTKWMRDILDSQREDGATTDVCPAIVVTNPAAPGWGDAVTVIPWVVYRFYGDKRILEESYPGMKRWVEYMRGQSKDFLYERKGYGDWVSVVKTPSEPIGSAYFFYSTSLLAKAAKILGKENDAVEYARLADRSAAAFHAKHFDDAIHQYGPGTQTSNLLPLVFGITPDDRRQAVADRVFEDVKNRDFHLSTGFLGVSHLLPALSQYGYHDAAYRVVSKKTYPSLGYMIEKGATTIWERWNSDKEGPGMNSRNHFAFGAMAQWFFEGLAGINVDPSAPGFKKIIIQPKPAGDLTWVKATYPSMFGEISVEWRLDRGAFLLNLQIPPNTSALVAVPTSDPAQIKELGVLAGKAMGVEKLDAKEQEALFRVGSGWYVFMAPWEVE
jgi:alpha-L-rhamnosidase